MERSQGTRLAPRPIVAVVGDGTADEVVAVLERRPPDYREALARVGAARTLPREGDPP